MTNEQPPRGRPRPRPKGFDDVPELSDEEVERRVGVRGGAAPRVPVERTPRPPRPARREERTTARDSLLLVGLVVVGLVAVRVFLPDGPLTAASTSAPSGSQAADVGSAPTASVAPQTLVPVITLPPGAPSPSPAEPTVEPTVPAPTPTLKPGETARPTPRVTPRSTPKPPPPPGSPTLTVYVSVVNTHGGKASPSTWRFYPNGANAFPTSFLGSSAGTLVTLEANVPYQFSDTSEDPEGQYYTSIRSSRCGSSTGGLLAPGQNATCTITKYDLPAQIKVVTSVNGPDPASAWDVSVVASGVSPSGTVSGSETGVTFSLDAHVLFDVPPPSGPSGYSVSESGTCSSSGLIPGARVTCTYAFTELPPPPTEAPPTDPPPSGIVPFAFLLRGLARRWPTTATG